MPWAKRTVLKRFKNIVVDRVDPRLPLSVQVTSRRFAYLVL